jgi:nucleotide-binding universal stress UspA family protein
MYKHLLIALDGSELAANALEQGVGLAKAVGAKLTLLNVTMPWSSIAAGELVLMFPPEEYERNAEAEANKKLALAATAATAAGVTCETVHRSDAQPYKAIIELAQEKGCDLIVMGSHGRRGLAGLMLGSVAMKTLTHAHIPVLIYRE